MLIDVFRQDPFTAIALTLAVERNPYIPTGIGALNIFDDAPQFTKTVMVESRTGQLVIIPTSPRGAPPTERVTERRNAKAFIIPRIAHGDTLMAGRDRRHPRLRRGKRAGGRAVRGRAAAER